MHQNRHSVAWVAALYGFLRNYFVKSSPMSIYHNFDTRKKSSQERTNVPKSCYKEAMPSAN